MIAKLPSATRNMYVDGELRAFVDCIPHTASQFGSRWTSGHAQRAYADDQARRLGRTRSIDP